MSACAAHRSRRAKKASLEKELPAFLPGTTRSFSPMMENCHEKCVSEPDQQIARRFCGLGTGNEPRNMVSSIQNAEVAAPIPSANERIATAPNVGFLRNR